MLRATEITVRVTKILPICSNLHRMLQQDFAVIMSSYNEMKRDYEIYENNEKDEKFESFRLFRYFRLFRNLSSIFSNPSILGAKDEKGRFRLA